MRTRSGAASVLSTSLSKIYYSPGGYWKGYSAFSKLANAAGVSENEAKEWLKKQALWQIYLPSPRYIPRPHWTVDKPNEIHQADLLFLPHDTVRRKTFKYASINVPKYNRPVGFDEVRLSPFAKVRYLFSLGEYEGGERRRATDPVWSLEIFELSHSKVSPDQPVMYYLSAGPKRSFVREELQVVPEDTELPPKHVK